MFHQRDNLLNFFSPCAKKRFSRQSDVGFYHPVNPPACRR